MSDQNEMVKAIEGRIAEEEAAVTGGKKPVEITSKFVMECLDAEQLGDGMLYAALHKDKFVYAKNSQQWFVWDEHTWRRDDLDAAISAVEQVAMRYAAEISTLEEKIEAAKKSGDDDDYKWAKRTVGRKVERIRSRVATLRKNQGRQNCIQFAHTNPVNPISIFGDEFDMKPNLLGVQNGVIDLHTGLLMKGNPSDYVSKRCGTVYNGLAINNKIWIDTLNQIYDGDQDLIAFMQRLYGSALFGTCEEHVFPVLIGRGRNGKSIMIEAISHTLGDYAGAVPAELLLDSNRPSSANQPDSVLMKLKGLRLAIASETGEGRKFSAERVKWLTGGDTITARGLYDKHLVDFEPTHLLVLLTNHEPVAPAGDVGFWERCFLIRHPLSFVKNREPEKDYERKADTTLPAKLKEAGPEILAWLVQGYIDWRKHGLMPPESVIKSTDDYRSDSDYIGAFITAACTIKKGSNVGATELYIAFTLWFRKTINDNKRFTPSQKIFGQKLKAREEYEVKKSNGITYYHGLELSYEYKEMVLKEALREDSRSGSAEYQGGREDHFT